MFKIGYKRYNNLREDLSSSRYHSDSYHIYTLSPDDFKDAMFINADDAKGITDAVNFAKNQGITKMTIVGGYQASDVADVLKQNNVSEKVGLNLDLFESFELFLEWSAALLTSMRGPLV